MKKLLLAAFLCTPALFGAITASTVWEVRRQGTTTSGGGFDATMSGAGTDMSQFDNKNAPSCTDCQSSTANLSRTDAVTNNTTTVTSGTANFSSALVGNTVYLSGPGTTTGWYQVTAVPNAQTITVDRNTGSTGGTGVTINIGGAIGGSGAALTTPPVVAGNIVYVKAGDYTITATNTFSTSGAAGNPITYIGYAGARGDGGMVTVLRTGGTTVTVFAISGAFRRFYNFIADSNASSGNHRGFSVTGGSSILSNCRAMGFTIAGFEMGTGSTIGTLINCHATGGLSGANAAFVVQGSTTNSALISCTAIGNAAHGFLVTSTLSLGRVLFSRCISANNTGSSDGFRVTNAAQLTMRNCIAYGNGGNGILFDTATTPSAGDVAIVMNSAFVGNGEYGLNSNNTNYAANGKYQLLVDYNAFYNNGSGLRNNIAPGDNDVTLTSDPFTDAGNNDFTLNHAAGGGAVLMGTGFPGMLQVAGKGYLDIGALQSRARQRSYTFASAKKANPELYAMLHPQFDSSLYWPLPAGWTSLLAVMTGAAVALWRRG